MSNPDKISPHVFLSQNRNRKAGRAVPSLPPKQVGKVRVYQLPSDEGRKDGPEHSPIELLQGHKNTLPNPLSGLDRRSPERHGPVRTNSLPKTDRRAAGFQRRTGYIQERGLWTEVGSRATGGLQNRDIASQANRFDSDTLRANSRDTTRHSRDKSLLDTNLQ